MRSEIAKTYVVFNENMLEKVYKIVERSDKETGGSLKVSFIRDRDRLIYCIHDLELKVVESSVSHAKLTTSSPFIWHSHPRNMEPEMSFIDRNTLNTVGAFQALSLGSVPPLFVIFSYQDNERTFVHDVVKRIFVKSSDGYLKYRSYVIAPSLSSFQISREVENIVVFQREYLDNDRCEDAFLIKSYSDQGNVILKPICLDLITEIVKKSIKYPGSIRTIMSEIRGIYSRGCRIDIVDLMRIVSIQNSLRFHNMSRNEFFVVKDCGKIYKVSIVSENVEFEVIKPKHMYLRISSDNYEKKS